MRTIRAGNDWVEVASGVLAGALHERLEERERASLALSGGSTPWPVFRALAEMKLDWARVDVYQVDERVAPAGDRARNLTGLREALLDRVRATVHPMPVEDPDLESAADRYAASLPRGLDVVHLGLGADGHTASLVPGDPVLEVRDRPVAITAPYQGRRRMTLTFAALERAARIVWIVRGAGSDKATVLSRLRATDPGIPAGRVPQSRALLITDEVSSS